MKKLWEKFKNSTFAKGAGDFIDGYFTPAAAVIAGATILGAAGSVVFVMAAAAGAASVIGAGAALIGAGAGVATVIGLAKKSKASYAAGIAVASLASACAFAGASHALFQHTDKMEAVKRAELKNEFNLKKPSKTIKDGFKVTVPEGYLPRNNF